MARYFWSAPNAKRMPAACGTILTNGSTVIEMLPGSDKAAGHAQQICWSKGHSRIQDGVIHVKATRFLTLSDSALELQSHDFH
jgi:hypothetical protein